MIVPDARVLAWCGAAGTLSDALGGVYLTYDLLGGRGGPLGILIRAATYGMIFGLGYGAVFGVPFGLIAGLGLGSILALEFWRVAYHQRKFGASPLYHVPSFGVARGLVLGAATMSRFGWRFGAIFGALNALFLFCVYRFRHAPTYDYDASCRPTIRLHRVGSAVARAVAVGASGALAGWLDRGRVGHFGIAIGAVVAAVSFVIGLISPYVEWKVENLPEQYLAMFGFALIFLGLVLQSVQYVVVILSPH